MLLLFLFALSISPRKYLHDVFANHTDQSLSINSKGGPTLEEKGFQCDQLDVVVDFPFALAETSSPVLNVPENFAEHPNHYSFRGASGSFTCTSLRGPPVLS